MRKLFLAMILMHCLIVPASASEITAPLVPHAGQDMMPEETGDFGNGILQIFQKAVRALQPDFRKSIRSCTEILFAALLLSVVTLLIKDYGKGTAVIASVVILVLTFRDTDTLIGLSAETVREICEYGKLLCLAMTTALAAQGAVTSSASLYAGTSLFTALLGSLISRLYVPLVYFFLLFSAASNALGEEYLRKLADSIKGFLSWLLKTLLIVFTTYMSITGVVAGTTDTAALKAAKVTISTAVPVVGGILSDASEAVLVSMQLMKNAAGIYGILAALAVFLSPFLKVGVQYLALKLSASLCGIFASKNICVLLSDIASAMGLLLAMLAAACTMVLVSTVCFLRGAG